MLIKYTNHKGLLALIKVQRSLDILMPDSPDFKETNYIVVVDHVTTIHKGTQVSCEKLIEWLFSLSVDVCFDENCVDMSEFLEIEIQKHD